MDEDRSGINAQRSKQAAKRRRSKYEPAWKPRPTHCAKDVYSALSKIRATMEKNKNMSTVTTPKLDIRINLVKAGKSKIRGYASIKVDLPLIGPFALNHIRVIEGSKGMFVSMPSQKKEVEGGEDQYYDHFHPLTKEGRNAIGELVLQAYEKKLATQE